MSALIRLKKEYEEMQKNPPCNCNAKPDDENIYN